jgi:hypothetical protein
MNSRVYVNGEIDTKENVFKNNIQALDAEEQLEYYGSVFYELTDEPVTNPRIHVARPVLQEIVPSPQMAEAGAPRSDGAGVSEVGNPRRPVMASAQTTRFAMPKDQALASDMPLLPPSKKQLKEELEAEGEQPDKLVFSFKKKKLGRKPKLVTARATPLAR